MFNIHTLQMTFQLSLFIIVSQENSFYHPITGSIRGVFGRAVRGHQSLRYPRQARNDHAQGYPVGAPYSWRARLRSLSTCDDRTSSVFLLTFPFLSMRISSGKDIWRFYFCCTNLFLGAPLCPLFIHIDYWYFGSVWSRFSYVFVFSLFYLGLTMWGRFDINQCTDVMLDHKPGSNWIFHSLTYKNYRGRNFTPS